MGAGLQRATAAAHNTQLDDLARDFLLTLQAHPNGAGKHDLGSPDRRTDRARQKCRRLGLALHQNGKWRLTEIGKVALSMWAPKRITKPETV